MVKKKSHEERHDEPMSASEAQENRETEGTDMDGQSAPEGSTEPARNNRAEENLLGKLTEMQDRYLRLSAEFDNYRKRTLREKIELTQSGGEEVIKKLLPIVDDFDRAMTSMRTTDDCGAIKTGLELIYTKVSEFLRNNGVKEMEVINEPFDSDMHEAVTSITVQDDDRKGKIIEVTQKGYSLNDKVIRFPKVIVGE